MTYVLLEEAKALKLLKGAHIKIREAEVLLLCRKGGKALE